MASTETNSRGCVFGHNGAAARRGTSGSALQSGIRGLGISKYEFMSA